MLLQKKAVYGVTLTWSVPCGELRGQDESLCLATNYGVTVTRDTAQITGMTLTSVMRTDSVPRCAPTPQATIAAPGAQATPTPGASARTWT